MSPGHSKCIYLLPLHLSGLSSSAQLYPTVFSVHSPARNPHSVPDYNHHITRSQRRVRWVREATTPGCSKGYLIPQIKRIVLCPTYPLLLSKLARGLFNLLDSRCVFPLTVDSRRQSLKVQDAATHLDKKLERKLRLKVDLYVVPTVAIIWLFCFIDRANIGQLLPSLHSFTLCVTFRGTSG